MADRYVTINEVANELRISYGTAWRAVQDGRIPAVQIGGPHSAIRVERRGYRDFITKSRTSGDAAESTADGNQDVKHG